MPSDKSSVIVPAPTSMPDVLSESDLRLYEGVLAALSALPVGFSFPHPVSGIRATDLFNLSSLMGAAIEDQVVSTLNRTREIWDSRHEWDDCMFVRKSQSFPDVRLVRRSLDGEEAIMGIELKGWYILSKEKVPSFRYQIAAEACAPMDLLCVVPWYLDNAVSGEARVLSPWIEQARYAAEWRDYWWEHIRESRDPDNLRKINVPECVAPYPSKAEMAHAVPVKDGGGNFGRLPRCKPMMESFIESSLCEDILGIPAKDWVYFISLHTDNSDPDEVACILAKKLAEKELKECLDRADELSGMLRRIGEVFRF